METMAERFERALRLRQLKPQDLVDQRVMSRANVYLWKGGTSTAEKVTSKMVDKVCKSLRINREWLLTGKGPIEGGDPKQEPGWADVTGYAQAVGLGDGAEATEYAETHALKFRANSLARKNLRASNLAVMYGQGDSMLPRIQPGDAILFDTSDTRPRDGAIFVVQWKGEIFAKRAEVLDDAVYFRADNPAGDHRWNKPKRMDAKRDPIEILGRVRWIGSWEE